MFSARYAITLPTRANKSLTKKVQTRRILRHGRQVAGCWLVVRLDGIADDELFVVEEAPPGVVFWVWFAVEELLDVEGCDDVETVDDVDTVEGSENT